MIVLSDSQHYTDIANAIREKNGETTQYKSSELALAIKNIQTGGIPCALTVETTAGAVVVATLGAITVSATAGADGVAILILEKEGTWNVSATLDGETLNTEVLIEHNLEETLTFVDPILENNSWEKISEVAKSGKASTIWNVGDTKTFTLDGTTFNAQIIGFDHDDVADAAFYGRAKAGITFQFKELTSQGSSMNVVGQETNSWADSIIRTLFQNYVTNKIIEESLLNVIVSVNKIYEPTYNTTGTCTDNLFLLSESELIGSTNSTSVAIGEQYEFYAAGNSRVKYMVGTTTKYSHWLRSRKKSTSNAFMYVYSEGDISYSTSTSASHLHAPAFCV